MSVQKEFEKALKDVKQLKDLSHQELLQLYGLYKQATQGDVSGPKPSAFNLKGKAKHKAWGELKGLSKNEAMTQYVALVKSLLVTK